MIGRGGRAGWFRIAAGFSALATLEAAFAAWWVSHAPADALVFHAPLLGAANVVAAALFAGASVLAIRHRASAGTCLLLGYAIPAGTLYVQKAEILPASSFAVVSMLGLIMATRRPAVIAHPTA